MTEFQLPLRQRLASPRTPFARSLTVIGALDPVRLAQVFLDLASVVRSQFWDGRRTGPDFISPMTSLTKRQSGHLAKLVLQHSKDLPKFEPDFANAPRSDRAPVAGARSDDPSRTLESDAISEYQAVHSQAVAVMDLQDDDVESQHTTPADVDLMVLVPVLLCLLVILGTRRWFPACACIVFDILIALVLGPGNLTLIRRTAVHPTELDPGRGCAVLMDDEFTMVIRGSQRIIDAITDGGFYFSFAEHPTTPTDTRERWQEKQVISDILYGTLEGGCRGVCEAIVMRFLHLSLSLPHPVETAFMGTVIGGRIMVDLCWWGWQGSIKDSLPPISGITPARSVARLTGEMLGLLIGAACTTFASPTTILLHGVLLLVQTAYFGLFARLVLQSQNYRIRTERFLAAMGDPVIRKWPFVTRASAATFVCLLLCRDVSRPVGNINILGVLDILIPNQRDTWRVWKERVADRIVHEDCMTFAPTIPTFPDWRQQRLKDRLDEAQSAYETYRLYYLESSSTS